ncbi:MAG: carbohydrate ABC transporter permease [Chloroflexi bacterium]|nr:carbohydrate ABC transporter permease [Chloroflexota bacterium]
MKLRNFIGSVWLDAIALLVIGVIFIVPFIFILLTAAKTGPDAAMFRFTLPDNFQLFENIREVLEFGDGRMFIAMRNSLIITVVSITLIVLFSALVAFVMQRRRDRVAALASSIILAGLIIPPAVVPTIFLLQSIGLYRTLFGLIFVQVAFTMPFAIITLRAFMATIPRELDEAAIIDGASPMQVFLRVILPLLRPAIITVVVVSSVGIYNDFTSPLYFLPGAQNVTVQLTMYSYISQFNSEWHLLFANVLVITVPPLLMFMFFQRQIVSGMTSGAIKG